MANVIKRIGIEKFGGGICKFFAPVFFLILAASTCLAGDYDRDTALKVCQAAIGNELRDYAFRTSDGRDVSLTDYAGQPVLISMIFTSCHHICPTTTKHIQQAVTAAEDALGTDTFKIVSIGFDTENDTPAAMSAFAGQQSIHATNWDFLSASSETIAALSEDLGFQFFPSPRGFDHLVQLSIIDRQSKVYSQVYGMTFGLPALVEPLKALVFNRPESKGHPVSGLVDRVRLFCTVYNPATGRYEFDNSLFIQIAIGFLAILGIVAYLWREMRHARSI